MSDINFPGIQVSKQAIAEFEVRLFELAKTHQYFVFAGSLPKGVDPALCASWIEQLQNIGKKVIFDSSRDALATGLKVKPWLIKPNEDELAELAGRVLDSEDARQQVAIELATDGIQNVVVSCGEKGVMWLQHDNAGNLLRHDAKPPKMPIVSTVGAGDTLVAGLCWGHMQHWSAAQTLSFATALSALAVSQVGVANIEAVYDFQKQVTQYTTIQ